MRMSTASGEVYYDSIALTGFLSKELNYADTEPFSKIYEKVFAQSYIFFIDCQGIYLLSFPLYRVE